MHGRVGVGRVLLTTTVTGPITNNVVDYWFQRTVMDLHEQVYWVQYCFNYFTMSLTVDM